MYILYFNEGCLSRKQKNINLYFQLLKIQTDNKTNIIIYIITHNSSIFITSLGGIRTLKIYMFTKPLWCNFFNKYDDRHRSRYQKVYYKCQ